MVARRWTEVSAWSRGQEVISMGDPGQRTSQSIGPEGSERRWNRHREHPTWFSEAGLFSSRLSSAICLLPVADQFSAFVSNPSSPLKSTVEEEEKDDGMLSFHTVAMHFLDASVSVLPISTLLGPDAR